MDTHRTAPLRAPGDMRRYQTLFNILKSALLYYTLVFGAGFALALIRVPFLVPRFGARVAELIELPVMLLVIFFAACWVVRRTQAPATRRARLMIGLIALGLLLATEFTFVLWLQGLTLREAIASRDPVSGAAYGLSLLLFAVMPLLVARHPRGSRHASAT